MIAGVSEVQKDDLSQYPKDKVCAICFYHPESWHLYILLVP